jgi:homogentisate 1,2-dioxygenase
MKDSYAVTDRFQAELGANSVLFQTELPDNKDTECSFLPLNPRIHVSPTQLAWHPFDIEESETDFVAGLKTVAGSGDPTLREGIATHVYTANKSMTKRAFVNSDGEFLIVPQQGALDIQTEFGPLFVQPGEIVVIQRGLRFRVELPDGPSRGYILEIWGSQFELPELGPLGANGLANARDFLYPTAKYEVVKEPWEIIYKLGGKFFKSTQQHSPFDVVAWHGNYVRHALPNLLPSSYGKRN